METMLGFLVVHPDIRFKSYYVVWKLFFDIICVLCVWKFKSYYVVWKLGKCFYVRFPLHLFKSYYVVWKHTLKDNPKLFENV